MNDEARLAICTQFLGLAFLLVAAFPGLTTAAAVTIGYTESLHSEDPTFFLYVEVECSGICVIPLSLVKFDTLVPALPLEGPTGRLLTIDEYQELVAANTGGFDQVSAFPDAARAARMFENFAVEAPEASQRFLDRFGDVLAPDRWGQVIVNTIDPAIAVWTSVETFQSLSITASLALDSVSFLSAETDWFVHGDSENPEKVFFGSEELTLATVGMPFAIDTFDADRLFDGSLTQLSAGAGGQNFGRGAAGLAMLQATYLPEPATWLLLAVALTGLRIRRRT